MAGGCLLFMFSIPGGGIPHRGRDADWQHLQELVDIYKRRGALPVAQAKDVHTLAHYFDESERAKWWLSGDDRAVTVSEYQADISLKNGNLNPVFQNAPVAFAIAVGLNPHRVPPRTPLMWTRGLQPDGTWRSDSPYAGKGGMIATADRTWRIWQDSYDDIKSVDEILRKWGTDEPTKNIAEALPPGARWVESELTPQQTRRIGGMTPLEQIRFWRTARKATGAFALVLVFGFIGSDKTSRWWDRVIGIIGGLWAAGWFWSVLFEA
jgi:hypothetical protein